MQNNELTTLTHPLITRDHLRRFAVVYIRQSTEEQVRENTGSTDFQRNLTAKARLYGWPDCLIELIDDDLGLSGSSPERSGWQRLQVIIGTKQVGAVFVSTISRLSRQLIDFEVFRLIAAENNTLIFTDDRFVDPRDSNDIVFSQMTAMFASFENRQRAKHMSQARMTKAKQGEVVSTLPAGWLKGPDGRYDYDPEIKDTIRMVIETFWQARSIYGTVKALARAGVQIPHRRGGRIYFIKPTVHRVARILSHPAYAGTYIYGKTQSHLGAPVLPSGQSKRIKVPEDRWIIMDNHHPAYMTHEQQEEVKSILKKNGFVRRDRPGRGAALTQGLLRCGVCGGRLNVSYHRKSYSYFCRKALECGEICTNFTSNDFDHSVLREVFKVLEAPPIDMLKSALAESRSQNETRLSWIESERERLAHEECLAQRRADLVCGSLQRVYRDALQKLENVLAEKERFEQKIAIQPVVAFNEESEEELEELCRLASEVPSLWHHAAVTHQERKEILRCIIDHIEVAAPRGRIDATIFWKTGEPTPFTLWRGLGRHNLIRELHAQKLTALEIREHLAAGNTSTGQVVTFTEPGLYAILRKLGLKPNKHSVAQDFSRKKASELYRNGRSVPWIVRHFNEQGYVSVSGRSWTRAMVYGLLNKADRLEKLHWKAITEARARGLTYRQMAVEFNERKLPHRGPQSWTALNIKTRWATLKRNKEEREQKASTGTELPAVVLRKSA